MTGLTIDKLLAKCREVDGCWVHRSPRYDGYVVVTVDKRCHMAHRLTYQYFVGEIPDGLHLDHLCRNRTCVNPYHLEPVPARVNTLRGVGFAAVNAKKTECINGHPFGEDTYRYKGSRICIRCTVERNRKYRQQKQFKPATTPGWEYQDD